MNEDCSCGNDVGFSKGVDEIGPSQLINQLEEKYAKAF